MGGEYESCRRDDEVIAFEAENDAPMESERVTLANGEAPTGAAQAESL